MTTSLPNEYRPAGLDKQFACRGFHFARTSGELAESIERGWDCDTSGNLTLDIDDNLAASWRVYNGATIAMEIDTTNAAEEITFGYDVVLAGGLAIPDDEDIVFGDDSDATMGYVSASNLLDLTTADVTAGGVAAASSDLAVTTGDRIVNDAAGSPASGDMTIQTGDTNCTDGGGTGGDSGALLIQTGDADSDAGTSGDSGDMQIVTGFSDDAATGGITIQTGAAGGGDSGDLVLDTGGAAVTPGNVRIGTTSTAIELEALTLFQQAAGADPAAALLGGIGTTGDPATTAVADNNFLEFRTQTTATSGDTRGIYMQLDFAGVGVGGDAVRGRGLVTAAGTAGTVDGGAFTLEYNGGSVAGQGTGLRGNVVFPNTNSGAGTVWGSMSEMWIGGTSFVNGLTNHAIHYFGSGGGNAATRTAQILNLFAVSGFNSASGGLFYANTAAMPANADASFRVVCPDGTVRHILLFNNEA